MTTRNRAMAEALTFGRDGDVRIALSGGGEAWASGLVPGETVEVELVARTKPPRARVLRVIDASPDRIEPECAYAERCGGCGFAHVRPERAREEKRRAIERAIRSAVPVTLVPSTTELGYRRRARLAFEVGRGHSQLGYRPPRSHHVLDIDRCLVLEPLLAEALAVLRDVILPTLSGRGELRLAVGRDRRPIVALRSEEPVSAATYSALESLVREGRFVGGAIFAYGVTDPAVFGDPVERTMGIDGLPLEGTIDGFSQANDSVADTMARLVREQADASGLSVLELYAGHGHLSVGLARDAARFVAVERSKEASAALVRNLAARGLAGTVLARDAADAPKERFDVVVLDPPRTGAAEALAAVLATSARRIVMVSCDPRTLERDLARLTSAGYAVGAATAFDMFPGTPHVESVVRLDASR